MRISHPTGQAAGRRIWPAWLAQSLHGQRPGPMKIIITANGYPDLSQEVEITPQELKSRLHSGEFWRCEAGCNERGMNDDPIIYHAKDDYRS